MEELSVIVKRIKYRNEETKFYVFDGETTVIKQSSTGKNRKAKSRETFVGTFMSLYKEDDITVVGYWENNEKFGREFTIVQYKKNIPQTIKGIQVFLKQTAKGIGDIRAKEITDKYGEDTLNIIAKNIKSLDIFTKLSIDQKEAIWLAVSQNSEFENLLSFMQLNNLDYTLALKIYKRFKDDSIMRIKTNPYCLFMEEVVSFSICDQIAKNLDIKENSNTRLEAALFSYIKGDVISNGNLYTKIEFIEKKFNKYLKRKGSYKDYEFTNKEIQTGLDKLEKDERIIYDTTNKNEKILYLKNNLYIENKIVELTKRKNTFSNHRYRYPKEKILSFLENYEKTASIKIAKEQKEAILSAMQNTISIITGGPGTGKTQTMACLIHCINSLSPNATIHLCSPTGKAAKRMKEMSGANASTIHRLVKIFNTNNITDNNIINGDFVIVDEASMIDAYVFYRFVKSLDEDVRLIIIGDYNQLPSVGAGLILRDLINSKTIKTTRLTEIFRQAKNSKIITNSNLIINTGNTKGMMISGGNNGDFYFINAKSPEEIQEKILKIMKIFITKYNIPLLDIQVLSPIKGSMLGTETLNNLVQNEFNDSYDFIEVGSKQFIENDKVIHLVNNYDLNVFNGETGIINKINYSEINMLTVDFPDKTLDYPKWALEELELSYAITVHKSQGSEFPVVIMPMHEILLKGLYRNLIYTAITRAKKKIVFVGNKEVFSEGIKRMRGNERNSRIKEKLQRDLKVIE